MPAGSTQSDQPSSARAGEVPTGWGLERTGADNGLYIAAPRPPSAAGSSPSRTPAPTGAAGTVYARCLESKQRASSGQRHAFATRVASFTEQLEGGGTTSRSCAASEFSVATGVSLPASDDIVLTGTTLVGERGAEWSFAQASGATAVQTSLICLARTTGFHR